MPELNRTQEMIAVASQMGAQYARMEQEGQPDTGWEVDVSLGYCPCSYNFTFKVCIHSVYDQRYVNNVGSDGHARLVYRGPNKRKRGPESSSGVSPGRPRNNDPALSRE